MAYNSPRKDGVSEGILPFLIFFFLIPLLYRIVGGKGQSLTFHGKNHLRHHTCLVSIILALLWKTVSSDDEED